MAEIKICHIDEIADPGSLEIEAPCGNQESGMFIVKMQGRLNAYVNSCPHTGVALNWMPDQFLYYAGELIQCAMHGALFRPENGFCVHGPCQGQSLVPVALSVREGEVFIGCD